MLHEPHTTVYPAAHTFRWEAGHYEYSEAVDLMVTAARQGGSPERCRAYMLAASRIEQQEHDDINGTSISGHEIKLILLKTAREVGWLHRKRNTFVKPEIAPDNQKICFVCRCAKDLDDFMTTPTVAQAKRYGWRPDTTQKIPTHVCSDCRRKRADAQRKRKARKGPRLTTLLKQAATPEQAERLHAYGKLKAILLTHKNRNDAAINQALKQIRGVDEHGEEYVLREYQFSNEDRKDFYLTKRDMLQIARMRLEEMLGEDTPIPPRWGLLLTDKERHRLQDLHEAAFKFTDKSPQLW